MSELDGWKEATIAWSVCASIHRQYAKGRDPFFKTKQADYVKHEEDCRRILNELWQATQSKEVLDSKS